MAGRYFDDEPSARVDIMNNLRGNVQNIGQLMIQKKMQEKQRQQELQDAVKKAIITAVLSGKGKFKTPVDINQMIEGGQMPNLSEFESTPDIGQMRSLLGMQDLTQKMEQRRRLGVMAEQEAPSPEEMASFPPVLGGAEGGKVMLPKEASFAEGQITLPTGKRIGEYLPGYEPKPLGTEDVASALRAKFAGGISKEELQRKALGIPFTGKVAQHITPAQALNILSDPFKSAQFKKQYPELYPLLEEIAKGALTGKTRFTGQPITNNENDLMDTNW